MIDVADVLATAAGIAVYETIKHCVQNARRTHKRKGEPPVREYIVIYNRFDPEQPWWVYAPQGQPHRYDTQQHAIDYAKTRARFDRGRVVWFDREHEQQGRATYARKDGPNPPVVC